MKLKSLVGVIGLAVLGVLNLGTAVKALNYIGSDVTFAGESKTSRTLSFDLKHTYVLTQLPASLMTDMRVAAKDYIREQLSPRQVDISTPPWLAQNFVKLGNNRYMVINVVRLVKSGTQVQVKLGVIFDRRGNILGMEEVR